MLCRPCARARAALLSHRHALHWGSVHALPYALLILVASQTGNTAWYGAALAAIWTCLADVTGTLRGRLKTMSVLAIAGSIACGLGVMASQHLPLALAAAVVIGAGAGLYGAQHSAVAFPAKLVFVAFLTSAAVPAPASIADATFAAAYYVAGSAIAMLVCLTLFPSLHDRRPRDEIMEMFAALAEFGRIAASPDAQRPDAPDGQRYLAAKRQLRLAIERAWQAIHGLRLFGKSHGLHPFACLADVADGCFRLGILMAENPRGMRSDASPARALARPYAAALAAIDHAVRTALLPASTDHDALFAKLHAAFTRLEGAARQATALPEAIPLAISELKHRTAPKHWAHAFSWPATTEREHVDKLAPLWHALLPGTVTRALRHDATVAHHALRLALGGTLSLAIATLLLPGHGYWLSITMVVVLAPQFLATRHTAWLRLAGSIAGAACAALLSAAQVPPDRMMLATPLFLAAAYAARVRGRLGVFAFFLTIAVVYFSWMEHPLGSSLEFAMLRGLDTLLGCVLALGMYLLAPRPRLDVWVTRNAALALDASATYIESAFHSVRPGDAPRTALRTEPLRARAGMAISLAEQALTAAALPADHAAQLRRILIAARRLVTIGILLDAVARDRMMENRFHETAAMLIAQQCNLLRAASRFLRRMPVAPFTMSGQLPDTSNETERQVEDQLVALAAVSSEIMRAVTTLEELRDNGTTTPVFWRIPRKIPLEIPQQISRRIPALRRRLASMLS